MSPLFSLGEKWLAEFAPRSPNVFTLTRDRAIRRREAKRFAEWRREILIGILAA